MNKNEAKQRIEKLRKVIDYHRYLYHVLDRQEISDSALDSLKKELFDLEKEFPELITKDSPTQRVAGKPSEKFKKAEHKEPMLSLNDVFSEQDFDDWQERILKLVPGEKLDFFCELKIDGLALELIYKKGVLETGSTRGDGKTGEDITMNLKTIEAIPLRLREEEGNIIARGEVFISKKGFEKVNKEQKELSLSLYANPRNLAAGSVRQLDPKITSKRHLDFFAYDLLADSEIKTHQEKHNILKELGFKTNPNNRYCKNKEEVAEFMNFCQKTREKLDYEIDGIVVIVNSNELFKKLGVVGKAPRGAIAFKFPSKEASTVVEDIKVQVGRTGALTPVACLKPAQIGGATITRATLHNENEIKRLGVKIGDTVIVGRAGDVIPDIIKVLKEMRTGKEKEFKMPSKCPACGSKIGGEAVLRCQNPSCFAKQRELFYHFVSKSAFNIEGLGPKIIDQLIDSFLVSDPSDLFLLKKGDLLPLERFAEKSAGNIIESIQSRKEISFPKFIFSLGIRQAGFETAFDLAGSFGSLDKLEKAPLEDLEKIKDIGPVTAKSIYSWFKDKKNIKLLDKLKKAGVKIIPQKIRSSSKLKGLIFVLTGELDSMPRSKAKEAIRELGGYASESISANTSYLVAGKDPGSKLDKAKKLGVKIINEQEFLKIIK